LNLDLVYDRLKMLSYTDISQNDKAIIALLANKVESTILLKCNLAEVPDALTPIIVDRVCGEFLWSLKQLGHLKHFNLESAAKQVILGDATVTFAVGDGDKTPEARLDALLSYLMIEGEDEILCYRQLKW